MPQQNYGMIGGGQWRQTKYSIQSGMSGSLINSPICNTPSSNPFAGVQLNDESSSKINGPRSLKKILFKGEGETPPQYDERGQLVSSLGGETI